MIEIERYRLRIKDGKPPGLGWNLYSGNERDNDWWRVVRTEGGTKDVLLHTDHWKESR